MQISKSTNIKKAEILLAESGFTNFDYVISLQGPTLILTISGEKKLGQNPTLKSDLGVLGIKIL